MRASDRWQVWVNVHTYPLVHYTNMYLQCTNIIDQNQKLKKSNDQNSKENTQ